MISRILQAALFPLYSKLSDTIGRAETLIVSMVFYTVSFVAQATANSYGVFVVRVPRSRMNIVDKIAALPKQAGSVVNTLGRAVITLLLPLFVAGEL